MKTKPLTKKSRELFLNSFTLNGHVNGSALHTSQGTRPLWGQIVRAGYLKPISPILGHTFAYELTPEGREYLKLWLETLAIPTVIC